MPAKRKIARPTQHHPPPQSDYETDTANLTDTQLLSESLSPPPNRSIEELNLIVLKRWYPDIAYIVAIAPYAVLYSLNALAGEWEKAETEGSLFVCRLTDDPYERYRVIILNRKSLENFTLDLVGMDNIQFESGYIMAQVTEDDICGIWVFSDGSADQSTADTIWSVIETCAKRVAHFRDIADGGHGGYDGYGHDHEYGLDGVAEQENQHVDSAWQNSTSTPHTEHPSGQQLDLASLFKRPVAQETQYGHAQSAPLTSSLPPHSTVQPQSSRIPGNTNSAFFATPGSDSAPRPEQTVLLDLFRNAKRG